MSASCLGERAEGPHPGEAGEVVDKNTEKLTEAGRYAAAQIGNQLNSGAAQLVAANAALESKARRFVLLLVGFAFVAGTAGGFVGARMAGM